MPMKCTHAGAWIEDASTLLPPVDKRWQHFTNRRYLECDRTNAPSGLPPLLPFPPPRSLSLRPLTFQWAAAWEPFGDTPCTRRRVRGSDPFPRTGSPKRCSRLSPLRTASARVSCSASSKTPEGTRSTADAERGDTAAEFGT